MINPRLLANLNQSLIRYSWWRCIDVKTGRSVSPSIGQRVNLFMSPKIADGKPEIVRDLYHTINATAATLEGIVRGLLIAWNSNKGLKSEPGFLEKSLLDMVELIIKANPSFVPERNDEKRFLLDLELRIELELYAARVTAADMAPGRSHFKPNIKIPSLLLANEYERRCKEIFEKYKVDNIAVVDNATALKI